MKRVFVVVAVVMVLSLVLSAAPASANPMMPGPGRVPYAPYYWVRHGDTLSGIAWRFGTSVWAIAQANGIRNPNRIYAGQCLFIPRRPMPGPGPMPGPMPIGGGWSNGFNSWSNSGYVSWGSGYPQQGPYWGGGYYGGGPRPMPYGGGQFGGQMPMGGQPMGGQMPMGGQPFGGQQMGVQF